MKRILRAAAFFILAVPALAATDDLLKDGLRQANAGQIEQALSTLRRAAAQDQGNAAAQTALGLVALQGQRYDEARTALERAVSLDPGSKTALFSLALLYEKQRQWDLARSTWQRFITLAPSADMRELAQRHLERLQ